MTSPRKKDYKNTYTDYKKEVEDWVVKAIDKNELPWTKPWGELPPVPPISGSSGETYKGLNYMRLFNHSQTKENSIYMTFNQVKKLGFTVKKGAKAQNIKFVTWKEYNKTGKEVKTSDSKEDEVTYKKPIVKKYSVFNIADTTMPILELKPEQENKGIEDLLEKNKVHSRISTVSNSAYYSPQDNLISFPKKELFSSEASYNSMVLHELTHWTGHKSRLGRDFLGKFNGNEKKAYAQEELVAEIGAFTLASRMGIKSQETNSIAYLDSWSKNFKNNEERVDAILTGIKEADKAIDFLTKDKINLKFENLDQALNRTQEPNKDVDVQPNKDIQANKPVGGESER